MYLAQKSDEIIDVPVGMTDGEKRQRHVDLSGVIEGTALVSGDMVGLVAPDLILGIVFGGMVRMSLVVEISRVDRDDRTRHATCLGIPGHMITDVKSLRHLADSSSGLPQVPEQPVAPAFDPTLSRSGPLRREPVNR